MDDFEYSSLLSKKSNNIIPTESGIKIHNITKRFPESIQKLTQK